ncbi:hypothetical protein K443DRAFT_6893 [Laccaria amethystina LaAM-08-1]|uniref:Uncharacterized protein n=1 Tax=Laccaria amethystina LaAM-08-1 TaxID=1095629 RepID=A0A0C9XJ92_9AGAR|nr:hypothetical protein K443DRAFT_6893 [Laccaria amethystina LaAM-08-1]
MSAHPRHSNANVHPAQVLLNSTTKRRTSAQVKADNEEAAAASASAVKAEAQNKLRRKQQAICPDLHMSASDKQVVSPTNAAPIPTGRISASEGGIRRNGLTYRVTCPPSVASTRSEPGLDKVPDTNNDGFSDGNSCFPPESTTDSESNGMVVGEVDDDEDFVMEQNKSDSSEKKMEAMLPSCTKKGKLVPKAPRGTFCLQVQGLCQEAPAPSAVVEVLSNKRTFKEATLDDAPSAKCGNKSEGRLVPAKDVNTEIIEGEFDHDDMSEALAAMRASKPSMVKARDSQKAMPAAVKIVEKPVTNVDTAAQQKHVKFTVNALPFPSGPQSAAYHARWRKHAHTLFIDYAATRPCAYRANSDLTPQVIHTIWNNNFPALDMEVHLQQNLGTSLEAVTSIAGDVLTDWCSSIGMNTFNVLGALFAEHNLDKDEIITFVPHALEGFRFIYADPDAPPSEKGGFKSDLILNLFASLRHLPSRRSYPTHIWERSSSL